MKKIAVMISGRLYSDVKYYNAIINNLINDSSNYAIDFFISYPRNTDKNIVNNVIELYKPKDIRESDEKIYNVDFNCDNTVIINEKIYKKKYVTNAINCLCMFYSRLKLHDMLNEEYDIVISTRMDLIFYSNITIKELEHYIEKDYLCIPNPDFDYGGINDQIAIGNTKNMKNYLSLYTDIINILQSNIELHPETILAHFLQKKNIKIHRFYINYGIVRC